MRKILYFFIYIEALLVPLAVSAQYDPQKEPAAVSADSFVVNVIGFILQIVHFLIGVWVLYILLIVFIAGILYVTSSGDENRMDTAIAWWKRCAIGIILAPIAYVIVNLIDGRLLG